MAEDTLLETINFLKLVHNTYGDGKLRHMLEGQYNTLPLKMYRDLHGDFVLVEPEESPRADKFTRLPVWLEKPKEKENMSEKSENPVDVLKKRLSLLLRFVDDEDVCIGLTDLVNDAIALTPIVARNGIRFPKTVHEKKVNQISPEDQAAYERWNALLEQHTTVPTGWIGKNGERILIWYNRDSNQLLCSELVDGTWVERDEIKTLDSLRGMRKVKMFDGVGQRKAQAAMELLKESDIEVDGSYWEDVSSKEDNEPLYKQRQPLL